MSAKLLPEHLLEQARHLARRERTRPRQASLRRAISTAYYAFFHFLIREAIRQISPNLSEENYNRVYRWFDHGAMYRVARAFSADVVRIPNSKDVLLQNNNSKVQFIASNFAELQELRHAADYDPGVLFLRPDVLAKINRVEDSFLLWRDVKNSPEANTFLLSFCSGKNGATGRDAPMPDFPSMRRHDRANMETTRASRRVYNPQ